jgi:hypothetical protein
MLNLDCSVANGIAQLCIIACPNNQWLGRTPTPQCSARTNMPDGDLPLQVVMGDGSDDARASSIPSEEE